MQPECTKRCALCGADKPLTDYYNRAKSPDGKTPRCKPCSSETMRVQRAKHRERRLAAKKVYYEANKAAHAARSRQYRAENPEKLAAWRKQWTAANLDRVRRSARQKNQRLRERVLQYYSDGVMRCVCCGERRVQFLALDHTNGGGNQHRQALKAAGLSIFRWVIKNGFPPIFRLLCHNCNSAIGYYGGCPHDAER